MRVSEICRYCGGVVRQVPASKVYGVEAARRLRLTKEWFYQCQNCNARVGCHRGTKRPLGNLANEVLRLKRMETHQVFDGFWRSNGMTRTAAYKWLAERMGLTEAQTHIGGFEMDQCQQVIDICRREENAKAA
ncbi:MAG: DUF3268 family zinc-finger domain-containing protein [Muribaculaceae bacterium]|nr:DUF3268 family zinc-finger domain-containing protein [Muribaculaceae bacterium]